MSKFNASLDRACAVARAEWSQATSSHHRIVGAIRHVVAAAAVACLFCRLVQGRHGCAN